MPSLCNPGVGHVGQIGRGHRTGDAAAEPARSGPAACVHALPAQSGRYTWPPSTIQQPLPPSHATHAPRVEKASTIAQSSLPAMT